MNTRLEEYDCIATTFGYLRGCNLCNISNLATNPVVEKHGWVIAYLGYLYSTTNNTVSNLHIASICISKMCLLPTNGIIHVPVHGHNSPLRGFTSFVSNILIVSQQIS